MKLFFDLSRAVAVTTNLVGKIVTTTRHTRDIRYGAGQEGQKLLCWVQANKLPNSMDAGEPISNKLTIINRRLEE